MADSSYIAALDIEDIDVAWLSQTLGYPIRSMGADKVGTGQTGASYRLTLDADQGPRTMLAKFASMSWR